MATSIGPRLRQVKKMRAYNCEYIRQPLSFAGNPLDSSDLRLRVPLGRRIVMLPGNDINGLVVHYAQQRVAGTQVIEQQMGFKRLLSTLFLFSCPTRHGHGHGHGHGVLVSQRVWRSRTTMMLLGPRMDAKRKNESPQRTNMEKKFKVKPRITRILPTFHPAHVPGAEDQRLTG